MKHELRIMVIVFIALFMIHNSLSVTPAYASENDIGYSQITPASPLYFLKGVREVLELKFAGTTRVKMLRQLEFATRRLREARTLIRDQNEELVPATLERYAAQFSELTDRHAKNDEVGIRIEESLVVHLNALERLYNQATSPRSKMFIRSSLNRLIQRADVTNTSRAPICQLFAKEASSSALNQTEQVVLSDRAQKCFKSLVPGRV